MKLAMAVLVIALLVPSAWAAPRPWSNRLDVQATVADKLLHLSGNRPHLQVQTGGENIATAFPIASLPFNDTGNTCGFKDDYDVACPYTGSTAPDVVYSYTPAGDTRINVDLCSSLYDTKVFLFDGSPANVVACNDDASCGYSGYQSRLDLVPLTAGHTYYIVVDGYFGDCGDYSLAVTEVPPPPTCPPLVACQSYDEPENEPGCFDGFVDTFDGGCNSTPPVLMPVTCGTICGTSGTYLGADGYSQYRDTDWYEITVGPGNFTYTGVASGFDLLLFVLTGPCGAVTVMNSVVTPACTPATLGFMGPGTFWLWAGPSVFTGVPCGSRYRLDIAGPGVTSCLATTAKRASWGTLKVLYR